MKVHKKRLYRIIKEELNRAIRESKWPREDIVGHPDSSHAMRTGQYPEIPSHHPGGKDPGKYDDPDLSHLGGEESDSWFNPVAHRELSSYIMNNPGRYAILKDSNKLTPEASNILVRDWFNATSRSPDPKNPMVSLVEKAKTIENFETNRPPVGDRPWNYYFGNTITYIQENGLSSDNWEESWTQKYDSDEAEPTGGVDDDGDPFGWRKLIS